MISSLNGSVAGRAYNTVANENKELKQNAKVTSSKESGQTKIERLKESIDSGEYKVDLTALATKMADELL
ncbi:MAG: flagellar biosynthesis anti-sigma factor FlgM [Sulfurimonas sp.]|jgi:flagellar biosynthesis anti-sigma factor FlgM